MSSLKLDDGEKGPRVSEAVKDEGVEEEEEEEEEAWMFFRGFKPPDGLVWYAITPNTPSTAILVPIFVNKKHDHDRTACAAVGSRIYVLGGEEDPYLKSKYPELATLRTVYYADAHRRKDDWRYGKPLLHPRADPYAVTIGGKIFVFTGGCIPGRGCLDAEIYDPLGKESRELNKMPYSILNIISHAVLDDGKRVLLLDEDGEIHSYDVANDSYEPYKNGVFEQYHLQAITVLDGILYAVGFELPGFIMSLDVTDPNATPKQVGGLKQHFWQLPVAQSQRLFLVPFGRSKKLALLWSYRKGCTMTVYCARMEMHRDKESDIVAKSLYRSEYKLDCVFLLIDFLPIFMTPSEDEEKKKGSKDSMIESEENKEKDKGKSDEESAKGNQEEEKNENIILSENADQEENREQKQKDNESNKGPSV